MTHVLMGVLVAAIVMGIGVIVYAIFLIADRWPEALLILAGLFLIGSIAALVDWYTDSSRRRKEPSSGHDEEPPV